MARIIINADDFGIRKETTELIQSAIGEKKISSTTILANGPCKDMAFSCFQAFPFASYGIHLNLTSFESLTHSPVLTKIGITDDKGVFTGKMKDVSSFTPELLGAIKQELKAQVEVVMGLGIPLSHADSHHHIHTKFGLIKIVSEVLKEYGIPKVRIAQNLEGLRTLTHFLQHRRIKNVNSYYSSSFVTTNSFYGIVPFYKKISQDSWQPADDDVIELMCHLGNKHLKEKEIVEGGFIRHYFPYDLISYNEL